MATGESGSPVGPMYSDNRWGQALTMAVAAYALANVLAGLTIFSFGGVLETIPAGLLAAQLLVPSILLYVMLDRFAPPRSWKHFGYWIPALALLGYCLVGVVVDALGYMKEGSGLPMVAAITFGVPAIVTYVLLVGMSRRLQWRDQLSWRRLCGLSLLAGATMLYASSFAFVSASSRMVFLIGWLVAFALGCKLVWPNLYTRDRNALP
jgi:hypothetical protein